MAPATVTVMSEPMSVSSRAHFRSAKRSRFSATQLCWKKSCHGAMVVPTTAMTRKTRLLVTPPSGRVGTSVLRATLAQLGCTTKASTNQVRSSTQSAMTARSQRR